MGEAIPCAGGQVHRHFRLWQLFNQHIEIPCVGFTDIREKIQETPIVKMRCRFLVLPRFDENDPEVGSNE